MRKIIFIALITFTICNIDVVGWTQPQVRSQKSLSIQKVETAPARKRTIEEGLAVVTSLDLRSMDIVDTIKFLAVKGSLNIVTSKSVSGRTTLFLKNVSVGDILDVLLLTNNLACVKKNNIITIMSEEEYQALYGIKYTDNAQIKTIKLEYALPTKVGAALENIKSSVGKIIMDDDISTIILIDTPEKLIELEAAINDLDKATVEKIIPTSSRVFELSYANVEDINDKISEMLTADVGSVSYDERTNKIVVNDFPNKIQEIERVVAAFDAKTRQVFIEAKIVEVTLNDDFAFGINWEKLFRVAAKDINFVGTFPITGLAEAANSFGKISIGTWEWDGATGTGSLDPTQPQAVLTFLSEIGKVKIISSPHISVCNNEEAKIMVGTRQPYATSTISQSDTTATTSWSAEFVDVGVTLTVTPTINNDGFVKMHIKPEVSTLTDWFEILDDAGTAEIRLPEIDTSNAETDIMIKDGRTIIIGGLIKESTTESERKYPFLGDIPLFGTLFKSITDVKETKELVVFITPHIITGEEDMIKVTGVEKIRKPRKK
ncbi:MAG: secretin N-terminal domain-containing protein [Candidatus Orphnella occulta]|nr:secretin N-terminal domain-containing protein [Candidatus Orphnella occulta]